MKRDVLLVPFGASWADIRDGARRAEDAGYDGVWLWDHLRGGNAAGPAPVPECWTALSALAALTSRVTLGPLVLNVATGSPECSRTWRPPSGGVGRTARARARRGSLATPYADEQVALGRPVEPTPNGVATWRRDRADPHPWAGDPPGFLRPPRPPDRRRRLRAQDGRARGSGRRRLQHRRGSPAAPGSSRRARGSREVRGARRRSRSASRGSRRGRLQAFAGLAVDRLIVLVQPPYTELRSGGTRADLSKL